MMLSDPCSTVIPLSTQPSLLKHLMPRIKDVLAFYFLEQLSLLLLLFHHQVAIIFPLVCLLLLPKIKN